MEMTLVGTLLVALGSGAGAVCRYGIGKAVASVSDDDFPWGTWTVNLIGTFLLGLVTRAWNLHLPWLKDVWWLLLGTGFCGAFTTFSTFSAEFVQLLRRRHVMAVLYLVTSLGIGFALAWVAT